VNDSPTVVALDSQSLSKYQEVLCDANLSGGMVAQFYPLSFGDSASSAE